MGTITVGAINQRAIYMLQDVGINTSTSRGVGADARAGSSIQSMNVRWTVPELLMWISDAQRAIVQLKPNSYNVVEPVPLVPGVRQVLPATDWLLLTVNANMIGTDYGRAVILSTVDEMNRQYPNWRADKKNKQVNTYMFDITDQKAFYVWPPNDGTGMVECNISRSPPEVTDLASVISLDDIFVPNITDYVCMRAAMKDAEFGPGLNYAQVFMGTFMSMLTGKDGAEKETNPTVDLPPGSNR